MFIMLIYFCTICTQILYYRNLKETVFNKLDGCVIIRNKIKIIILQMIGLIFSQIVIDL